MPAVSSGLSVGNVRVITGPDSVWPKTMSKVTPISFSTRRTSSAGTVAPPDTTSRSDRRSRPGNVGSSRQASSIVGTSSVADPPSCSTRLKNRAGSNQGASTIRPRACTGPSVASTQPAVWNIGIGLTQASSGPKPRRCMLNRELLVMARWASRAPFGNPVVPDVYWIWAGSSGVTSGSAPPAAAKASPEARNSSKRVRSTTSRSSGSSARTDSRAAAIGLPRFLHRPTTYSASSSCCAGSTSTSM